VPSDNYCDEHVSVRIMSLSTSHPSHFCQLFLDEEVIREIVRQLRQQFLCQFRLLLTQVDNRKQNFGEGTVIAAVLGDELEF